MTELVGREREIAGLEGLLSSPSTTGGALVLRGEPGIGKSALLRLAEHTARARGFTVLTATGWRPRPSCRWPGSSRCSARCCATRAPWSPRSGTRC